MRWLLTRDQWLFCIRAALSMLLAYFVTHGHDPTNAIYAILGAGLVTAPSFGEGIGVSKERLIGTLLGAAVSVPASWLGNSIWSLIAALIVAPPLGIAIGGPSVARIATTIAAVGLVLHPEATQNYGILRFTNTLAGVCVALAVSAAFWPVSGRRDFPKMIDSTFGAGVSLLEYMARFDREESAFAFQRKLFLALSNMPKSTGHARLDPMLLRSRARLDKEAFLTAKIAISLLSASLMHARICEEAGEESSDQIVVARELSRHLAERLRSTQTLYSVKPKKSRGDPVVVYAAARADVAPQAPAAPSHVTSIIAELIAIDGMLDELQSLRGMRP